LLKAAERSFDFGIGSELVLPGLCKTLQNGWKMRSINFFGLAFVPRQAQHGESDLILAVRRQTASRAFSSSLVMAKIYDPVIANGRVFEEGRLIKVPRGEPRQRGRSNA
jgi:hypothetical protein